MNKIFFLLVPLVSLIAVNVYAQNQDQNGILQVQEIYGQDASTPTDKQSNEVSSVQNKTSQMINTDSSSQDADGRNQEQLMLEETIMEEGVIENN